MVRIYNTDTKRPAPIGAKTTITTRLNTGELSWKIANSLYDSYSSGLRELVANAVTAVEAAISAGLVSRGEGLVAIHIEKKSLVIEDNGTGISWEVFERILRVIGNSGNFARDRAGQFGMGFYAFTTLSTTARITTRCADGSGFTATCDAGTEFLVDRSSPRAGRGTTIELALYDGTEVDREGAKCPEIDPLVLLYMAETIGLASDVAIDVRGPGSTSKMFPATGLKKWIDSKTRRGNHVHFVRGDLEIAMILDRHGGDVDVYLNGMPVGFSDKRLESMCINIRDERKYEPSPSRETLTNEAEERLVTDVIAAIRAEFKGLWGITGHETFTSSSMKHAFVHVLHSADEDLFKGLVPKRIARLADGRFEREDGDEMTLDKVLEIERPAFAIKRSPSYADALSQKETGITPVYPGGADPEKSARIAAEWGLPLLRDELKKEGIRINWKNPDPFTYMTCHTNPGEYELAYLRAQDGSTTVVHLDKSHYKDVIKLVKNHPGSAVFIRHNPRLAGDARVTTYQEWLDQLQNREVQTQYGIMSAREATSRYFWHVHPQVKDDPLLPKADDHVPVEIIHGLDPLEANVLAMVNGGNANRIDYETAVRCRFKASGVTTGMVEELKGTITRYSAVQNAMLLGMIQENVKEQMDGVRKLIDGLVDVPADPLDRAIRLLGVMARAPGFSSETRAAWCSVVSSFTDQYWFNEPGRIFGEAYMPAVLGAPGKVEEDGNRYRFSVLTKKDRFVLDRLVLSDTVCGTFEEVRMTPGRDGILVEGYIQIT